MRVHGLIRRLLRTHRCLVSEFGCAIHITLGFVQNKFRFQRVNQTFWLWHPCRGAGASAAGFRWSFRQKPETTTGYRLPTLRVEDAIARARSGRPTSQYPETYAGFGGVKNLREINQFPEILIEWNSALLSGLDAALAPPPRRSAIFILMW